MKAFHLTKIENLYGKEGICAKGLIPTCGERSKSIGDTRCVISFTSKYYTLPIWWLYLYPETDPNELCVLSFDIDKKRCIKHINDTEFYTYDYIPSENINIANFYDKRTMKKIPFIYLNEGAITYYDNSFFPSKVEVLVTEIPVNKLINNKQSKKLQKKKQNIDSIY